MTAYIAIERQYGHDLAIEYPTVEAATAALNGSPFIDGLCEEDSLDAYVAVSVANDAERIIPPEEP